MSSPVPGARPGAGEPAETRRIVVVGDDGAAVSRLVAHLRDAGHRVAGFVGEDEEAARAMAVEMLGGLDEVARPSGQPPERAVGEGR